MFVPLQDIQGLVFNEHIVMENALKILKNWDDILNRLPAERRNLIKENAKEFDPLLSLKKICKNKGNINTVNYLPSKNLKNRGRLFAQSASLQNLPREFRGAIGTNYHDLDMKNAHPTILLQYCKKNDIKCDMLEQYVNNRDEILTSIANEYQLDKADMKQKFLAVMNGGKFDGITNQFFVKFKDECDRIHKFIASLNEDLLKEVKKRKDFNINGSITNIILCEKENLILLTAVQYLMNLGYNVDVLVFDGMMVRKVKGLLITQELLDEINKYVLENTGYDIKFVEKELDKSIDLSIYETITEVKIEDTYFKDKENFETNHFKTIHPPIYVSYVKEKYELQSKDGLIQSYEHIKSYMTTEVRGQAKQEKVSFIKTWINDENIRKYDTLVFTPPPLKHDPSDYNTWLGFDNEKKPLPADFDVETNEYVLRFKEFIFNLVDGRENYINYIISWIANIIQYPACRSQVCIVLYSLIEGVGKSKLCELIEKVVDEKYSFCITDVSNQLFGKHSMAEYEKLFIILNEIKGKDTYSNSETFKQRITDAKRDFEPKGLKAFNGINYCNYMCSTNNINAVNVGEKDRRFCVITCNNRKAEDKVYFLEFENDIIKNEEAIRCIYEYLKTFPIEEYVPNRLFQKYRPTDDALYQDLKDYNRDIEVDFLEYFVKRFHFEDEAFKKPTKEVWGMFETFLSNNGESRRMEGITSKKFHFSFKQKVCQIIQHTQGFEEAILYSTKEKRIAMRGDDCYVFNIPKLKAYLKIEDTDFINEDD